MSRKALIPEFWITSDIGDAALRTLLIVALHADKQGHAYVKNDLLAVKLKKDVRRIQSDLNKCESMGFLTRKFDDKGKRFFVINRNACTDDAERQGMTLSNMTENVTPCLKTSSGDDAERQGGMTLSVTSPKNPYIGNNLLIQSTIQSTAAGAAGFSSSSSGEVERQLEPFEAGMVPSSPPIRVAPVESRQPVRFESPDLGELKNKFFEVLGPWAESIHRKISHEMIDSGFVAWLLEECRSVETPYKLFQHKLKTEWQGGNWVRPEELKRLAKAEKLRKHEEFLRSLT